MESEDYGEEVELNEGMPVQNEDGEDLGKLAGMLMDEEAEEDEAEAEFVIIEHAGVERLVPYEAIVGVGDGALLLNLPMAAIAKFPKLRAEMDPTDAELEMAYKVYDENAVVEDEG